MKQLQQNHAYAGCTLTTTPRAGSPRRTPENSVCAIPADAAELSLCPRDTGLPFDVVEAYAARLAQFYCESRGGGDEHPVYTDYDWRIEAEGPNQPPRGYWNWVVSNIEHARAMWPWDREATPAVLVAKAAKISVEQVPGKNWVANGLCAKSIEHMSFVSELEAWQAAANAVLAIPQVSKGLCRCEFEALPLMLLTHGVSGPIPQANCELDEAETLGKMREFERAGNHWVQVAQAAGFVAQASEQKSWKLANGPAVPTIRPGVTYSSESAAWRAAAVGLLEHLRLHLECSVAQWQAKSPGQHLELARTFYADYRPPVPDFAFTQHHEHSAKVLCQNVGWRVNKVRGASEEVGHGWQLNRTGHYFAEADAWLAGADKIRRLVMQRAKLSYLEWLNLSLDDQISMGLTHAL